MRIHMRAALTAAVLIAITGPALAQAIPPGQSCGGLLCDMGVFGHKVAPGPNGEPASPAQIAAVEAADPHRLPCHDFVCRAFGQKDAEAAPPPAAVEPAPMAEPEKPVKHARKHKRVAKAEATPAEPAPAAK